MSLCLGGLLAMSCSDSTSDEFEEVNGKVEEKLIETLVKTSVQNPSENKVFSFTYNSDGSLNTANNGEDTGAVVYENDQLSAFTGGGNIFNVEELFESPYNAFEIGQVLEYDNNGNPKTLMFLKNEYDYDTDEYWTKEYTAEIKYDDAPNPFYSTLAAAGVIDALDKVKLNFSITQPLDLVKAKLLFPLNNPSQIIYKNEEGETLVTLSANYDYDEDNYPKSAVMTSIDLRFNESTTLTLLYSYVN